MIRKVMGFIFTVIGIMALAGSFLNGSFTADNGSAAAISGRIAGTVIAVLLFVSGGLFLIFFDKIYKENFETGYRKRKTQSVVILVFLLISVFIAMIASAGLGLAISSGSSLVTIIGSLVLYASFFITYTFMLSFYALPFWNSRKMFSLTDSDVNDCFNGDNLTECTGDGLVLAGDRYLFFKRPFCIIPYDRFDSVMLRSFPEKDIYFILPDGKKFAYLVTLQQYNEIVEVLKQKKPGMKI